MADRTTERFYTERLRWPGKGYGIDSLDLCRAWRQHFWGTASGMGTAISRAATDWGIQLGISGRTAGRLTARLSPPPVPTKTWARSTCVQTGLFYIKNLRRGDEGRTDQQR